MEFQIWIEIETLANRLDAKLDAMEQRMINVEQRLGRSDRFRSEQPELPKKLPEKLQGLDEPETLIELPMEPFTLPPAEQATKPAPQHSMEPATPQPSMEPTPLPPPLPASEPSIPKVARVAKEHCFGVHTRHRVVERIGFRSYRSLLASCSAFVHLGHLHPAAALPSAPGPSLSLPALANGSLRTTVRPK